MHVLRKLTLEALDVFDDHHACDRRQFLDKISSRPRQMRLNFNLNPLVYLLKGFHSMTPMFFVSPDHSRPSSAFHLYLLFFGVSLANEPLSVRSARRLGGKGTYGEEAAAIDTKILIF